MAQVCAMDNIVTALGLTIASPGETGEAIKGAVPYDPSHDGEVLVQFEKRKRAYWCKPEQLAFLTDMDNRDEYVAKVVKFDPFGKAAKLPTNTQPSQYHFGDNLRLCRMARKLTQTELGRAMGRYGMRAAQATICYREGRPYSPNGKFVEAAARVLRVPSWLFFVNIKDCNRLDEVKTYLIQTSSSICEETNGQHSR